MILKFPNMREELLGYLNDLLRAKTDPAWIEGLFDQAVHFLFDDTPLPHEALGYYLASNEEVRATQAVVEALDVVLTKYGTTLKDAEYFSKPEWVEVERRAEDAMRKLQDVN
jgi:hypothetical protein